MEETLERAHCGRLELVREKLRLAAALCAATGMLAGAHDTHVRRQMNKDLGELLSLHASLPELPGLRNVWAAIRKSAGVKAVPSAGGYLPPLACAAALCCAGNTLWLSLALWHP